jgi:3-deoxy-manno-octulosonate cytidylyltransferase (CMP-KDO synthetase)
MPITGVIPARYASTRLPGKPLVSIAGKPLIQWVWEAACQVVLLDEILVATDDQRIANVVEEFGGTAIMTDPECPSGTDRIAEALQGHNASIVVNIQGDEPLLDPLTVQSAIRGLLDDPKASVASAMVAFDNEEDWRNPSMVKVLTDAEDRAILFSRAPVPDMSRLSAEERRIIFSGQWPESFPGEAEGRIVRPMKHLGLYVYRRAALDEIVSRPVSALEWIEKLEQLRFLEAGHKIRMVEVREESRGVDTPEDVLAVEALLLARV